VLVVDDSALVREAARVALAAMPGWEVLLADCGEEALALAESVRPDAILLDVVMPGMDGLAVAEQLQARGLARTSSVVFLTGMDELEEWQTGVVAAGVIAKPFANAAVRSGRRAAADRPGATLQVVWDRHRDEVLDQVSVIERAQAALSAGQLDEPLRLQAKRAAHMLAGSVGMFGFMRASALARELELELANAAFAEPDKVAQLAAGLRSELEGETETGGRRRTDDPGQELPLVLIVDHDADLRERIRAACTARDMECAAASDAPSARMLITRRRPAAVLLGLTGSAQELTDAYALLSELSATQPDVPVVVLTGSGAFTDRVEAARRGSRAFLPKSLQPEEVLGAVEQLLRGERLEATRVLVVDDDPMILEAMSVLLGPHGIEISTLADPNQFWTALEETEPELVILDLDMPGVNGEELCRTVRNDPRWSSVAVIFITASTDAATVELVFNAGADDYVPKPIVEAELVTRVSNRLERVRLLRAQAETDGLTGLCNRVTSEQRLKQLLTLRDRLGEALSVALLDLDRFKQINDTWGHAVGDQVLRRLGECLRREFRGNDVVGRWGGEEFVIGMFGMNGDDARKRIAEMLERFSGEAFEAPDGAFHVTFSAGVAEHGRDGADLEALCEVADRALYGAKAAGRARVVVAA
jgi:diguanylate cyclase (GGDEF)-like protein